MSLWYRRAGTIVEQMDLPGVGIWLMPDNTVPGTLEHFIAFLVDRNDPLWERAKDCVEQIPEASRRFPVIHLLKAHIHTWLAWQKEPGVPFGLAITMKYLDAEEAHAQQFIAWLHRLFPSHAKEVSEQGGSI